MICKTMPFYVFYASGLSSDDAWVARDTVVQELRPGADSKTDEFV